MTGDEVRQALINRFLSWPLPDSVCADACATRKGSPHRSGTTLLTADEAGQMIDHLLGDLLDELRRLQESSVPGMSVVGIAFGNALERRKLLDEVEGLRKRNAGLVGLV